MTRTHADEPADQSTLNANKMLFVASTHALGLVALSIGLTALLSTTEPNVALDRLVPPVAALSSCLAVNIPLMTMGACADAPKRKSIARYNAVVSILALLALIASILAPIIFGGAHHALVVFFFAVPALSSIFLSFRYTMALEKRYQLT